MANYRVLSTAGGAGDGDPWSDAYTTLAAALSGKTSADTLWVGPSHAETAGAAITLTLPSSLGLRVLGVASDSADPATALASPPSAVVAVGAANAALSVDGFGYVDSVIFRGGTNNSATCVVNIAVATNPAALFLDRCRLELPTANAAARIYLGPAGSASLDDVLVDFRRGSVKFGATGQSIGLRYGRTRISDLSLDASGSTPTTLFVGASAVPGSALIEDSDLTGLSFTNLASAVWVAPYELTFERCKLPSGVNIVTGTHTGPGGLHLRMYRCANGDTEWGYAEVTNAGTLVDDSGITRSGGGPVSIAMDTTANVMFPYHPLVLRGSIKAAAGSHTLTVQMVIDRATALTNADVALRAHVQDTSGSTLGSVVSSEAADVFATPANLSSSSATWSGTGGFANEQKREIALAITPDEDGYIKWELCVFTDLASPLYVDAKVDLS